MKDRNIQIFRAIAIIAVVMIHTTPAGQWQIFCKPFINFAVATFIFLSGYLTKADNDDWLAFCRKRISRVLVPYIIWTVIYSIPDIKSAGMVVLVKNLICANATTTLHLGKYMELFWTDACLGWFTFYYLGLILGNRIKVRKFKIRNLAVLYCASLLLQMAEGYLWFTVDPAGCGSQLKLTSILSSSIFMLIIYTVLVNRTHEPKCRLLGIIGDYSFGIYLTHMMILKGLESLESYKAIPYPITSIIVMAVSFIFCFICVSMLGKKAGRWLGFV